MADHTKEKNDIDDIKEIGYVVSARNYLLSVNGLPHVLLNEIVQTKEGARGIVTALKGDLVEVLMLDEIVISSQQEFFRTKQALQIAVGPELIGRTINALGVPIDGKGKLKDMAKRSIYQPVPGLLYRYTIKRPIETGITRVDMLTPLARGQRQLVMGDVRSGKIGFVMDVIANQKDAGILCIYAMVGKRGTEIRQIIDSLDANKAIEYSIVVASSSSELPSLIYLTPAVALTIAEYFQSQGRDVLVILDDLGDHAKFYRELSLLGGKTPGRESYPGDIFFQHARLMERGGSFSKSLGGGSITIIPVINTNDPTAFMTTNLMAMTDGHLEFNSDLHHQGVRPAINTSLSVSRVGRQTQILAQQILADKVRTTLTEAARIESLSRLGGEASKQSQKILQQKRFIDAILQQPPATKISLVTQIILLAMPYSAFLDDKDEYFLDKNLPAIRKYLDTPAIAGAAQPKIAALKEWTDLLGLVESLTPGIQKVCGK